MFGGGRSIWVQSHGGPLVLLPVEACADWTGAMGPDYRAACQVDDYLGVLKRRSGDAVVFGDEPLATCFLPSRGDFGAFARVSYAEPEHDVTRLLGAAPLEAEAGAVQFTTGPSGRLRLLDAGAPGADAAWVGALEAAEVEIGTGLELQPEPGRYGLDVAIAKGPGYWYLVHPIRWLAALGS